MAQDTYQGDGATKLSAAPSEVAQTDTIHVLELPRSPTGPARSSVLRVQTGSIACKGNPWALGLEHLVSEITTRGPAATRPEAWVVLEVDGGGGSALSGCSAPLKAGHGGRVSLSRGDGRRYSV